MNTILSSKNSSNEWYTPHHIIDSVKKVLGQIDLDPCTDEIANNYIQAKTVYAENGLEKEWFGNVFCNPPYNNNAAAWSYKFATEPIKQGVLLVNANFGYKWFNDLIYKYRFSCCILKDRLFFIPANGQKSERSRRATAIFYRGNDILSFEQEFYQYGRFLK